MDDQFVLRVPQELVSQIEEFAKGESGTSVQYMKVDDGKSAGN